MKKALKRGFTLVELMIVVAIVGVLAALAIYGVRKYIANAKTAEAKNGIGQIAKDATSAYAREGMAPSILAAKASTGVINRLCLNGVPVPAAVPLGKKYQSSPQEWQADQLGEGFACLRFSMSDPQYYRYNYTAPTTIAAAGAVGAAFAAIAEGDLDGDSTTSLFQLDGKITKTGNEVELFVAPNFIETNPEE